MIIKKVSSGTKWEDLVGYSRGVRVGNQIEIAGTTAVDEAGRIYGQEDPAAQTRYIIRKAKKAIVELGGELEHVIRTRIYVTNIAHWEAIGTAHGEFFGAIKPATTMVEVSNLIQPGILVEIEFTAILSDGR